MAADINSTELCVKAIRILKQELANAKKTLLNAETCVVNRGVMQAQLDYLDDNLPDTVRKAAEIVREEETIRNETEQKRSEILNSANSQAQDLVTQASNKANSMMEQANYEVNELMDKAQKEAVACVDAGRAEASRILEDAEKKARQLVEEENIVRRARVESDEIRDKTQQEMAQLRKNTLDFVDNQLSGVDRALSEMLNGIRLERNEVRNHR